MRAFGEHRALLPTLDFSAQYARSPPSINYAEYYKVLSAGQRHDRRCPADPAVQCQPARSNRRGRGEAVKARSQAEAARNQVSEETLKLQRTAEQLEAAREVAQLEYQLAQSGLEAAQPASTQRPALCTNWPTPGYKRPSATCSFRMPILSTSAFA
jgi:hypothetical protein